MLNLYIPIHQREVRRVQVIEKFNDLPFDIYFLVYSIGNNTYKTLLGLCLGHYEHPTVTGIKIDRRLVNQEDKTNADI